MFQPVMPSSSVAPERSSNGPRFLGIAAAGLGALLTAALFLGAFDGGLPKSARADVAAAVAPSVAGLCFHGAGGELLDFAPAGQGCR